MSRLPHCARRIATLVVAGNLLLAIAGPGQEQQLSAPQGDLAAAVTLYQEAKYPEALAATQKFQTTHKFSALLAEAIYYEGWCFWAQKQYANALATFERLARMYPTSPLAAEAVLRQAECSRALEKWDAALTLYQQFIAANPQHDLLAQAMLGEAGIRHQKNDPTGAKAILEKMLTQFDQDSPVRLDALFLLGQILNKQKDFAGAQVVFQQIAAQRTNPRATEGLFLAAETMFDDQRFADAIDYYQRVQPKPVILTSLANEIKALEARRGDFFRQNSIAVYQAQMENLRRAQQKFAGAVDLHPAALFRIANCQRNLGRPEPASETYRQFLSLYPEDKLAEQAHFGLIQSLAESRQLAAVETEKKAFETKFPGSKLLPTTELMQAESLFGRQEFAPAIASYQKFIGISKDPDLIETAQFRIAISYFGLQQFPAARDALTEFLRQHPQSKSIPDVLYRLGRTHYELSQQAAKAGQTDVVRTHFTQAAGIFEQLRTQHPEFPNLAEANFQLGYIYSLLGAFDPAHCDQAIAVFSDFVKRWPDYVTADKKPLVPEALFQIARNQALRGHFQEAAATYQQIVDQHATAPLAPFAAFEIANVYATAKQPTKIIEALRRYVEKFPDHSKVGDALYSIGWTLESDQQPDDALQSYQELVKRAIARIDQLPEEFRNAAIAGQIRIATILGGRDKLTEAVAGCEEFLNQFSREPVAARTMINQIATLYRKARQTNAAYSRLDQIGERFVHVTAIRHATATAAIELALSEHDYPRANPPVQRLLVDPQRDELPVGSLSALGSVFLKTDRFGQALENFQLLRTKFGADPRHATLATLGIGQAQLGLQKYDEAGRAFQELLAVADLPASARSEAELGLAKVNRAQAAGRPAEDPLNVKAVELLTRVLAGGPSELAGEAAFHLGNFFFEQRNDPQKGRANCQTALAYFLRVSLVAGGPLGEEAAFRCAQCQEFLGNSEAARSAYAAYARRFPAGSFAKEAQTKLGGR